ncbi:MAG: hypothetical protein NUK63_06535 [Candidatus Bathyarchaeum tardum]|nr:MAG: hypothetical protein NUK63_06535 [Candidatus Bathyarchaeum tardum]
MKKKIHAVHDRDLLDLLKRLNLLEQIKNQEIICSECNCVITLDNLGFMTIKEGNAKICCDNILCFYEFKKRQFKKEPIFKEEEK